MGSRHIATRTAIAAAIAAVACCAPALAGPLHPLPESSYTVKAACSAPRPGHAACMSLKLVPLTAQARAHTHPIGLASKATAAVSPAEGSFGLRPSDLHTAYTLPTGVSPTQTIAIVDAYDDPHAESDLTEYSEEFGLPLCTKGNGCFRKLNQSGATAPLPEAEPGWDLEISLDIETAHAICQSCHILLVEAESSSYLDLETAERRAETLGANEISNSWGGAELGATVAEDNESPFNHPGTVITVSAGDSGYLDWHAATGETKGYADYPASSPHVVAVGGTRLFASSEGVWERETVWNGGAATGRGADSGGCSKIFPAQPWQLAVKDWSKVGCGSFRAVSDISADADPYTGVAVHDTSTECTGEKNWCTIGGTSLSSPLIAATFALAGGARGVEYPAQTLYANVAAEPLGVHEVHDVTEGSNGRCTKSSGAVGLSGCETEEEASQCAKELKELICLAAPGYDGPTGLGTPHELAAFTATGEEPASKGGEETKTGTTSTTPLPPAPPPLAPASPAPAPTPIVVTALALTPRASAALHHALHPRASAVRFVFTLSAAAGVHVTLARRQHGSFRVLRHTLSLAGRAGSNSARLSGRVLAPGVYQLTVTPSGGTPVSIRFRVR